MGSRAMAAPMAVALSTIATAASADVVHLQCQMQPRGGGAPYDKTLSVDGSAAAVVDDGVAFTAAGREVRDVSLDGVPVVRVFKVHIWSANVVAWGEEFYSGGRRITGGDVRYQLTGSAASSTVRSARAGVGGWTPHRRFSESAAGRLR